MSKQATRSAIDHIGRPALTRRFNISREAVRQWYELGRIPADRVLAVEAMLTDTTIDRHQLRPDIFGPPSEAA